MRCGRTFRLARTQPCTRPIERFGDIITHPNRGGLHFDMHESEFSEATREQMTDIERYRQGAEHSAQMARKVNIHEIRLIWLSIEQSYRVLLQREERIVRAKSDAFAG